MEGQKVILLEQATAIGTETSSRNSEVIHSGSLPKDIASRILRSYCISELLPLHIYIYSHDTAIIFMWNYRRTSLQ